MSSTLILVASVLVACIIGDKISSRIGVPTLFFFIALGMLFGSDGLFKIEFSSYRIAEVACSSALIFIMFYGGFGTKWSIAKPVASKSILLSTLGVLITAGLTGVFCHFVLGTSLIEGLLIGSVLGSTDAASVFSILRSQRLNLKYGTASMLEIESGSNDPCAYMLTIILLSVLGGDLSVPNILYSIFAQLAYGIGIGIVLALTAGWLLRHIHLNNEGLDSIFLVAVALAAYGLPSLIGGNGYLSTYIAGILLGNQDIPGKRSLVNFFDAFNGMMQMFIFFLLGLLVFPSRLPQYFVPSLLIALFMAFVARPLSIAVLLTPFRAPFRQQLVLSWAGLRGAASIVFAIMAAVSPNYGQDSIFQIVFCVVLLSILFQGTLLPWVARRADMLDNRVNVLKTFNDYSDETSIQFIRLDIPESHPWCNHYIRELNIVSGTLIAAILRDDSVIMPKGDTLLQAGDQVILGAKEYRGHDGIELRECHMEPGHRFIGRRLRDCDFKRASLVVLVQRHGADIIPDGETQIEEGDNLVLYSKT